MTLASTASIAAIAACYRLPIILAFCRQRTTKTRWISRIAYLSPMADKVDMHRVPPFRWNERLKYLLRILGARPLIEQTKSLGDSPYMGIDWKCWFTQSK